MGELWRKFLDLPKEQKAAFVLVVVIGGTSVVLGALSFTANIRRPIETQIAKTDSGYLTPSDREAKEAEALKTRDTDGDGLSDYDEQQIYRTSSYLKDSDSDGLDDRAEVMSGTNPNCPTGTDCGAGTSAPASSGTPVVAAPTAAAQPKPATGFKTAADLKAYFASLSPAEIRQALAQAGVPQETVDGMTDDQIKESFQKSIDEAIASGQFSSLMAPADDASNP